MAYNKSAGVYITENDVSIYSRGNAPVGAALITPTVKGRSFVPTIVSSFDEYLKIFGSSYRSGSDNYEYLGSIAAREYFSNGGDSLLVTKISTGSYAPATSNIVSASTTLFVLETLSDGDIMNNSGSEIPLSSGSLVSGSEDNIRWEISGVNASRGTFDVIIRRGDDSNNRKIVLETFTQCSLDPNADNYVANRIGDEVLVYDATNAQLATSGSYSLKSSYVRVKSVNVKMYDMLNPDGTLKTIYTGSLPISGTSGSFSGASDGALAHPQKFFHEISGTNSQGFTAATTAYTTAINLLSNTDEYDFDVLFLPAVTAESHPVTVQAALAMCEARGDAMAIIDPVLYGSGKAAAISQASGYNSSYGAMYYPWVQLKSPSTSKVTWCPPSTVIAGVLAFNDSVGEHYSAPAGLNRGGLPNVIKAEVKLSKSDRDALYDGNVNPIASFPNSGVITWGQKTLQFRQTALDRINVRRLMSKAKKFVKQEGNKLLFEANTQITRLKFLNAVNPYFENIQQKQGLYAFQVKMDEDLNTNEVIDRNELIGKIVIQPAKTIEFINIEFGLTPTGVTFLQ